MKRIFILFPILTLLVAGCSLTQKPAVNNSTLNQPIPLSQEQNENSASSTIPDKNEELDNVSEKWTNTPAEIKSISPENKVTYLSIDILSHNPKFSPGVTEFFINESTKLREVATNDMTKSYLCGAGPDGDDNTADVLTNTSNLLATIQEKLSNKGYTTYYFDINNNVVQAIYEQCLP